MLKRRDALPQEKIDASSLHIAQNLLSLSEVQAAQNIAAYMSFRNEVSTRELISKLVAAEKQIFIPYIADGKIAFTKFKSFDDFAVEKYNIPEPKNKAPVKPDSIDLFIVPGIAFDSRGSRIGWGKGFYDKFLGENKISVPKVGVCYDFQVIENIPLEEHDVAVDIIVTEKRIIKIPK